MSNVVSTDAVTEMRVDISVRGGLPLDEVAEIVKGVAFSLDLCGFIALNGLATVHDVEGLPPYEEFPFALQVKQLHYGSPIKIVIDLQPLFDFLTNNGYLVFIGLVTKVFADATGGWKSLLDALAIHRRNKLKRRERAGQKGSGSINEQFGAALVADELAEREAMKRFLQPLIQELLPPFPSSEEYRRTEIVIDATIRFIDDRATDATSAGEALRNKEVSIGME